MDRKTHAVATTEIEQEAQVLPLVTADTEDGDELVGPAVHGSVLHDGPGYRSLGLQEGQTRREEVRWEEQ